MYKRIFKNMAQLSAGILLVVLVFGGLLFYRFFYLTREAEVKNEAIYVAAALEDMNVWEYDAFLEHVGRLSDMRVTLIAAGGDVVYDNESDPSSMENHQNRPEVLEAKKKGHSSDIRLSKTLDTQTFYYAILLKNGGVIRISCATNSIFILLLKSIPVVLVVFLLVLFAALERARKMTRAIVEPINSIDIQDPRTDFEYGELKPLLLRIKDYNAEVAKNEQMRREFSANVSHELKTPLTSISGYAELMKNRLVKEEDVPGFAEKIYAESARMIALVEDIIKLSRLDEKKIAITKEPCNLLEIAGPMEERLADYADKYKVDFTVSGHMTMMMAVPMMIEEIMYNLATNAIKYNHPGGYARLTVGMMDGQAMIRVEDNGIGILKEDQERIFERFYRVDKSRSKQTGGTGLGLAIVKHVAQYHNGRIELESQEGKGTRITVLMETGYLDKSRDTE